MGDGDDAGRTVSWRELLAETTDRLRGAVDGPAELEARWIVEEASGREGAELLAGLDDPATVRTVAHLDAMVARRLAGEPIQYVLGHWAFRHLDLLVDRRVLIPRPETEQVVEHVLAAVDEIDARRAPDHPPLVVDLGTGSGAIALAVATERPRTQVWATDASAGALAVARANLAGIGRSGSRVRLAEGSWFEALDPSLRGGIDVLASNPPYIAADESVAPSVVDWEPSSALVAGPDGLEAHREIVAGAAEWLAPDGVLVVEIGPTQAADVAACCRAAGFAVVRTEVDHAGHDRAIVAHRHAGTDPVS